MDHVVVVGGSLAGLTAASTLREEGYAGRLTVVERGESLPVDRPPLSKALLAGTVEPDAIRLPHAQRVDELDLDLRLGVAATALDAPSRRLALADGSELTPEGIVLAPGATPRRLPTSLEGVFVLRDLEHSLAIREELAAGGPVAVVGAGFIGAEVAATCREAGADVTMIEAQALPMQRVLPGEIGGVIADLHRDHGVDVRLGVGVEEVRGSGHVDSLLLTDGTEVAASVVVAGIGVTPAVGWLEGSGLAVADGVRCDETLLAAPGIVAAGDAARWVHPDDGEELRVEQWDHAIASGQHAARRLLAGEGPGERFAPVPYFWSDQYDRKIQLAGRVHPDDEVRVVDGSLDERRFVALFRRGDRCVAVLGMNRPAPVVRVRMAMGSDEGLSWDDALAAFEG